MSSKDAKATDHPVHHLASPGCQWGVFFFFYRLQGEIFRRSSQIKKTDFMHLKNLYPDIFSRTVGTKAHADFDSLRHLQNIWSVDAQWFTGCFVYCPFCQRDNLEHFHQDPMQVPACVAGMVFGAWFFQVHWNGEISKDGFWLVWLCLIGFVQFVIIYILFMSHI